MQLHPVKLPNGVKFSWHDRLMVASTPETYSLTLIAGFADIGCCSFGRRESKSKRNNKEDVCVNGVDIQKKEPQEMFGLLQVCLFSVFAEGCRADTREKEGSSRSSITSLCLYTETGWEASGSKERWSLTIAACMCDLVKV